MCICDIFIAKSPQLFTLLWAIWFVTWLCTAFHQEADPVSHSSHFVCLVIMKCRRDDVSVLSLGFKRLCQLWLSESAQLPCEQTWANLLEDQERPHGRQPSCPSQGYPGPPNKVCWAQTCESPAKKSRARSPLDPVPSTAGHNHLCEPRGAQSNIADPHVLCAIINHPFELLSSEKFVIQ